MIVGLASTTPAMAATETTISLSSSPGWCANVENHNNVSGEYIWLWSCSTGQDLKWIKTGGSDICSGPNPTPDCFEFQDAQNTRLCLGAPIGSGQLLVLVTCGGDRSNWYNVGSHLESGAYGSLETIAVDNPIQNGAQLAALNDPPPSGWWWSWSW
jgi:hypothetical protein